MFYVFFLLYSVKELSTSSPKSGSSSQVRLRSPTGGGYPPYHPHGRGFKPALGAGFLVPGADWCRCFLDDQVAFLDSADMGRST